MEPPHDAILTILRHVEALGATVGQAAPSRQLEIEELTWMLSLLDDVDHVARVMSIARLPDQIEGAKRLVIARMQAALTSATRDPDARWSLPMAQIIPFPTRLSRAPS